MFWDGKIETIISWIVLLGLVIWVIYAGLVKPVMFPNPTHTQMGGAYYDVRPMFGCMRFPYQKIEGVSSIGKDN